MTEKMHAITFQEWLKDSKDTKKIKLAVNTTAKRLLLNTAQILGLTSAICFIVVLWAPGQYKAALLPISVFLLTFLLYKSYDHYLLDLEKKSLFICRKFFNQEFYFCIAEFKDFFKITIDGQFHEAQGSKWWEYFIVIVLKNGKILRISDYKASFFFDGETSGDEFFQECNKQGQKLATLLAIDFFEGQLERRLEVNYQAGEVTLVYKEYKSRLILLFMGALFFVFLLSLMIVVLAKLLGR